MHGGGISPTISVEWRCVMVRMAFGVLVTMLATGAGCGPRGEIRVVSDPPGAIVICNGVRYDTGTPLVIPKRAAGLYCLTVEKEGYRPARRSITLLEDQRVVVEFRMELETALLLIESDPPGADVQMDGTFRGRTPFFVADAPLGEHRFVFEKPGYLPREVVERAEDRLPRRVRVELVPNTGRVVVRTTPPGATVRINGSERGLTPCEVENVPAGDVVVEASLEGYEPFTETFELSARQTREIAATLKPFPTQLIVVSIPERARLYVNNQYRGETPQKITDLQPGEHRLRVELRGYETAARSIRLQSRVPVTEEFRLAKNSGKLVVVTEPAGVKVFLNDEEKGETRAGANPMISEPFEIDLLPPGEYRLSLLRSGFQHAPRTVRIEANAVATVHEKMTRRYVADVRVRIRGTTGEIVREGMLIRTLPDGSVELMLETGTIMLIPADEVVAREPLHPRN